MNKVVKSILYLVLFALVAFVLGYCVFVGKLI